MTGRTGRHQQQGDAVDADWAPVTDGNGSAAVRAPVETAAPARHRPVVSAANLRLAVLAVMIVVVGAVPAASYLCSCPRSTRRVRSSSTTCHRPCRTSSSARIAG